MAYSFFKFVCQGPSAASYNMMTSSNGNIYWPFVRGYHRSPVISPHKGNWRGTLMFSLICTWINVWVNNRETGELSPYCSLWRHCSGSLEPESSCHDRDWIMELPMEADILTFTGILTPGDASVASCFPFDITISLSWFPLLSIPPLHSAIPGDGKHPAIWAVTLVTLKIQMYPDGYQICILRVTIGGYRITAW